MKRFRMSDEKVSVIQYALIKFRHELHLMPFIKIDHYVSAEYYVNIFWEDTFKKIVIIKCHHFFNIVVDHIYRGIAFLLREVFFQYLGRNLFNPPPGVFGDVGKLNNRRRDIRREYLNITPGEQVHALL